MGQWDEKHEKTQAREFLLVTTLPSPFQGSGYVEVLTNELQAVRRLEVAASTLVSWHEGAGEFVRGNHIVSSELGNLWTLGMWEVGMGTLRYVGR